MNLTSLLQLIDKLKQVGNISNLQQGVLAVHKVIFRYQPSWTYIKLRISGPCLSDACGPSGCNLFDEV